MFMAQFHTGNFLYVKGIRSLLQLTIWKDRYLIPNKPCILSKILTENWHAVCYWDYKGCEFPTNDQSALSPSFDILVQEYGTHCVPVVLENMDLRDANKHEVTRREMLLMDAVRLMRESKAMGSQRVYIKDWHLIRQERLSGINRKEPYATPEIFADDC